MHYPGLKNQTIKNLNKIGFSVLAAASLMNLFKRQRDAVGLSIYSDKYDFYAPEKGSERHFRMLISTLENTVDKKHQDKETKTYTYLHQIAEKIHRRSLIFLFTDMFQTETEEDKLFEALRHLKYNKHEVILFHVMDKQKEFFFDFDNAPKRFTDVETGAHVDLYADTVKEGYEKAINTFFENLKLRCLQYGIKYVEADIAEDFNKVLLTYLVERRKFA